MFNLCADNTKLENLTFLMRHSGFFFVDFVTNITSQFAVSEVIYNSCDRFISPSVLLNEVYSKDSR